jgi:succinoglycan biosynthesis transport protein ExoP
VQQGSEALNLDQALGVLRRRVPLIALCLVVVAGAAYGFSKHETKRYTATAALSFSNNPLSQQIAGLPAATTNPLIQQADNVELVKGGNMAAKTAGLVGHGLTERRVSESLNVASVGESSTVLVSSTLPSPTLAAAIANAYAHQFVKEQQNANHQYFKSALALVNRQLDAIPPAERFSAAAVALQGRAQTLHLLNELGYGGVQVTQEAAVPSSPSSPNTKSNTLIGGVLGLLIGLGLAILLERLDRDRRIKEPEDLEAIYDLPLLGVVPASAAFSGRRRGTGKRRAPLPPAEAEAFHLIRARLRFFNVDRDVRTILVASAAEGEGKTTVARGLAEAAARTGARVLILEADLRHPALASQLDVQPGPGLPDVLIGAVAIDEATQSVDLEMTPSERTGSRTLDVLTCGPTPPNPGELIESQAMTDLLGQLKSVYDLVVIDTPPLTAVSDAFPLLRDVDGVVLVGWIGRSRRDLSERLHQTLDGSGAPLLGVIANGSKSGVPSSYVYGGVMTNRPAPSPSANGASPPDVSLPKVRA